MSIALDSALSGLRVAQQQLDVIAGNVSNASTEGYTRKVLPQQSQVVSGTTIGVISSPITRMVDMNMQQTVWTQVAAVSFSDVRNTALQQIQNFNGPADQQLSIAASISSLQSDFVQLSNQPDDQMQIGQTVTQAQAVAKKFNDYGKMITQMRNDSQTQIAAAVTKVNDLLQQIASINQKIKFSTAVGTTTAADADQRDQDIKTLSGLLNVTTFQRGDGVLVVQTTQGQQLADENASTLSFSPSPIGTQSTYPQSVAGLFVGSNSTSSKTAIDLTKTNVGGQIGAYLDLRDSTLPKYQAQMDEMAQQLAYRFNQQGVKLFTDASGAVPSNSDPIPNPPGPLTPVAYVGFASQIQVNPLVLQNNNLIQASTLNGLSVQPGSAEFLNRIVDYTFGSYEYQQANGSVDLRVSANAAPNNTLQNVFGLNPQAQVVGNVDIRTASSGLPLDQATGNPFTGANYTFTLRFDQGGANDTGNLNIDLSAVDAAYPTPPAASGADALVSYLNNVTIPGLGAPLSGQISASLNQFGQLIVNSQTDVTVGVGNMGTDGLSFLGLSAGTTAAQSPSFSVQVGGNTPVQVSINPGDDENSLLTKLNNVPGVQASIDAATGKLTVRPGPNFGGGIKLISGPILSSGGNTALKELFGSDTPVANVPNQAFRTTNLGAGADISTGVVSSGTSITDYAQKVISAQAQDANNATSSLTDETSYRDLIQKQFQDNSGVNLDQELSQLIVIQTAYSASAKTISTLNDMFKTLLNSI